MYICSGKNNEISENIYLSDCIGTMKYNLNVVKLKKVTFVCDITNYERVILE